MKFTKISDYQGLIEGTDEAEGVLFERAMNKNAVHTIYMYTLVNRAGFSLELH